MWRITAGAAGLIGLVGAGLLWSPATLIGVLLAVAVFATAVSWCSLDQPEPGRGNLRRAFSAGIRAALVVVALAGLCTVLGPTAIGVALLLFLTSPPVVERVAVLFPGLRRSSPSAQSGSAKDAERVSRLTTQRLCQAWTTSCHQLRQAPTPEAAVRLVTLRQLYLDELERRDPVGLNAWLSSTASPAGDPSRFLTP